MLKQIGEKYVRHKMSCTWFKNNWSMPLCDHFSQSKWHHYRRQTIHITIIFPFYQTHYLPVRLLFSPISCMTSFTVNTTHTRFQTRSTHQRFHIRIHTFVHRYLAICWQFTFSPWSVSQCKRRTFTNIQRNTLSFSPSWLDYAVQQNKGMLSTSTDFLDTHVSDI